jgi:hypothetical protein
LFLEREDETSATLSQAVLGFCFPWWKKEKQQQNGVGRVVVF